MRQWHVDPRILCTKHLLGEHLEHHMFLGVIKKQGKLDGYLEKNLLAPLTLQERHDALADEMNRRGYRHISPLLWNEDLIKYLGNSMYKEVDSTSSLKDLLERCSLCKERFDKLFL